MPLAAAHDELSQQIPLGPLLQIGSKTERSNGGESGRLLQGNARQRRRTKQNWLLKLWTHDWVLEIISCCVAGAAFVAVIVTLALHHDRPIPQWPGLISINSLISVFTAIMKASLLLPVAEGTIARLNVRMFKRLTCF